MKIGVVDYNAGNLTSIETALKKIKADYFISTNPDVLINADKLIFPGVGEASYAMKQLCQSGNDKMLQEFVKTDKPLFGICLGAQILFSFTDENITSTLDLIKGEVIRFDSKMKLKIPHMGWNNVNFVKKSMLFNKIPTDTSFYFVHSFFMKPMNKGIVSATTDYGIEFCSAIESSNIYATQFHPEKSGKYGLQIMRNFVELI